MVLRQAEWNNCHRPHSNEEEWKRGTFYTALNQMLSSLFCRFEKIKDITCIRLRMFDLIRNEFKDTDKLSKSVEAFCVLYGIDTKSCAVEVKSFAHLYPKL